jgi:2,4-dienoyl-CoA reductase-like NADH-dependent reductase (Old Yellow Enzyme family)
MTEHPRLSAPLSIGRLELPHRILMGSMHTGMEDDPEQFPELAACRICRASRPPASWTASVRIR